MKSNLSLNTDQAYLTFLQNLYLAPQPLTKEAIEWLLGEMAYTISHLRPEIGKEEIIALLIDLQKLKLKDEKNVKI